MKLRKEGIVRLGIAVLMALLFTSVGMAVYHMGQLSPVVKPIPMEVPTTYQTVRNGNVQSILVDNHAQAKGEAPYADLVILQKKMGKDGVQIEIQNPKDRHLSIRAIGSKNYTDVDITTADDPSGSKKEDNSVLNFCPTLGACATVPLKKSAPIIKGSYKHYDTPEGSGEAKYFQTLFHQVSRATGVRVKTLNAFAAVESSFNPKAKSSVKGTHAQGLFQFTYATWVFATKRFGKAFGITAKTSRFDPRANALMAASLIAENINLLKENTDKNHIKIADIYLAHLLGRTGSLKFFSLKPGTKIAKVMPRAAKNNRLYFYNKGKALTRKEVYAMVQSHIADKTEEFGLVS